MKPLTWCSWHSMGIVNAMLNKAETLDAQGGCRIIKSMLNTAYTYVYYYYGKGLLPAGV